MQTYNIFPQLFAFSLIAPLILRVVLGFIFLNLGYLKLTKEKAGWINSMNVLGLKPGEFFIIILGIIELVGGLLLITGAYVQVTALILAIIAISELLVEYKEESFLKRDFVFYLLLATICISLILTGAGLYAIDVPVL